MSKLTETKNRISDIERAQKERQKREEREAAGKRELREILARLEVQQRDLKNALDK